MREPRYRQVRAVAFISLPLTTIHVLFQQTIDGAGFFAASLRPDAIGANGGPAMSKWMVVACFLFFAATTRAPGAAPSGPNPLPSDWQEREALFERVRVKKAAALTDEDRLFAIRLLAYEARHIHSKLGPDETGEAYGEYYSDVALFVKNLHDPRSIDALSASVDVANSISTTLQNLATPRLMRS